MKKRIIVLMTVLSMIVCLTGCASNDNGVTSNVFTVSTGDHIKVEIDASYGYSMSSDSPVTIYKNGTMIGHIIFINDGVYDRHLEEARSNKNTDIIDTGSNEWCDYFFKITGSGNNKNYTYEMSINDSKTGIYLTNFPSKEETEEAFRALKITRVN